MPRQQPPPVKFEKYSVGEKICSMFRQEHEYDEEYGDYYNVIANRDALAAEINKAVVDLLADIKTSKIKNKAAELSDAMKAHLDKTKEAVPEAVNEAVEKTFIGTATFTAEAQWCRCHPTTGMTNTDKHCDKCGTPLKTVVSFSPDHCVGCGKRREIVSLKCPEYSWWNDDHYWKSRDEMMPSVY